MFFDFYMIKFLYFLVPSRPDRLQIDLVTSTSIQVSWQRQRGMCEAS